MAKISRPYRPIFWYSKTPAAHGVKRRHFVVDWLGYGVSFVVFGLFGFQSLTFINRRRQNGLA